MRKKAMQLYNEGQVKEAFERTFRDTGRWVFKTGDRPYLDGAWDEFLMHLEEIECDDSDDDDFSDLWLDD